MIIATVRLFCDARPHVGVLALVDSVISGHFSCVTVRHSNSFGFRLGIPAPVIINGLQAAAYRAKHGVLSKVQKIRGHQRARSGDGLVRRPISLSRRGVRPLHRSQRPQVHAQRAGDVTPLLASAVKRRASTPHAAGPGLRLAIARAAHCMAGRRRCAVRGAHRVRT